MVPYLATLYICLASITVCNKENALYDSWGIIKSTQQECIDTAKRRLVPMINKDEDFKFDGERLKIHIDCKKYVDI